MPIHEIVSILLLVTIALCLIALIGGCIWVKESPEAVNVRLVPADRVVDCIRLGSLTTKTVNKVSVVNRNAQKVEKELVTLAQNEAVESGADTIVATTKVVDGRRTFAMFKCLN